MNRSLLRLIILSLAVVIVGCGGDGPTEPEDGITVTVMSDTGVPIEGAQLSGGIDWDYYHVRTDSEGKATLPKPAAHWDTDIRAHNHFPQTVRVQDGFVYHLHKAEVELEQIGHVGGYIVKFTRDTILQLQYHGELTTLLYDETGVREVASAPVVQQRRRFELHGDTLWCSTFDTGVYAYDISDPTNPQQLLHIVSGENLGAIAVQDSLVAVAGGFSPHPVTLFAFRSDGTYETIAEWGDIYVAELEFHRDALIVYGNSNDLVTVLDVSDPANPQQVYRWTDPYYWFAFREGDTIYPIPRTPLSSHLYAYPILDVSEPAVPVWRPEIMSNGQMSAIVNDSLAIGTYDYQPAILKRVPNRSRFHTIAIAAPLFTNVSLPGGYPDPGVILEAGARSETTSDFFQFTGMVDDYVLMEQYLYRVAP
ncbi:MAG: hypothetical protein GF341_08355 [candidate division Zixibacteria bacterium]|nr:hypothetical protein [candidate division Zixibacteria bacterium]